MSGEGGMPELQPRSTTNVIPYLGRFRVVGDLEVKEMMFLLFAFVSVSGASIISIVRIRDTPKDDPELNFAILLLVNLVFILYYVVHGVFCERPFELMMSVIGTIVVMLYCILEFSLHGKYDHGDQYSLKMSRLIAVCTLGPVDIVIGCIIAAKFYTSRSLIYRTVGGNAALQEMCQVMFMFTAFLKFDFQLVISLLILIVVGNTTEVSISEKLVIGTGIPYSFLWVILGFVLLRYESQNLIYLFLVLSVAEPAYIIFLFVRTKNQMSVGNINGSLNILDALQMLQYCILFAGALGLIIRLVVIVLSVLVMRNFGKGLKEKVYLNASGENRTLSSAEDSYPGYDSTGSLATENSDP